MPVKLQVLITEDVSDAQGLALHLISGGQPIATATADEKGCLVFDVDPATLSDPAVRLAPGVAIGGEG